MADISSRARGAAKWSLATEVVARTIAPVTQLILARILAPEAFGVLATVLMVVSFAEMLADAGFQKYLIQRNFPSRSELDKSANVAFWSSITIATVAFSLIAVLRDPLALLLGAPSLGAGLAVASLALPLTAVATTQQALYRREFSYKRLMPVRIASSVMTLVVSLPLALLGFGYWSLILGVLASALCNALLLTILSHWRPRFYFSIPLLRDMFSFSGWSLLEALAIWTTTWASTFIVGSQLNSYDLGLFRQPMTLVNAGFALVTSATTPILFSALSRLQSHKEAFTTFFFRFQLSVALAVMPIGILCFFFRDQITYLLLGPQWSGAALMLGCWSLSTGFLIVFSHYHSEVYRALGRPRVSLVTQVMYMAIMIPVTVVAAAYGLVAVVIASAAVRVFAIIIKQVVTHVVAGISFTGGIRNLRAPLIASAVVSCAAFAAAQLVPSDMAVANVFALLGCGLVYVGVVLCFPEVRAIPRALRRGSGRAHGTAEAG